MQNEKRTSPVKKKKKRRLRKQAKYTIAGLCILLGFSVVYGIAALVSPQPAVSKEPTVEETTPSTTATTQPDPYPGITVYPSTGETVATIMLDPGHGDLDPGNVATDAETGEMYDEKSINLKLAKLVAQKIEETNPNIQVLMTRTTDDIGFTSVEDDLNWRVGLQEEQAAQEDGLDYFISLHCNALAGYPEVTGYSFYVKPYDTASQAMAKDISRNLQSQHWSSDQGTLFTDKNPLQVVSFSPVHAMLIEVGYMTNDEELTGLLDDKTLNRIATGIASGISDYIMANPDAGKEYCRPLEFEEMNPGMEKPSAHASDISSSVDTSGKE